MFSVPRNAVQRGVFKALHNINIGCATRSYVSRAHPKPIPTFPITEALQFVLEDCERRREKRERKEIFYNMRVEKQKEQNKTMPAWTRGHPDETIELALNLNLDPRKPGQSLRGSVSLPHGTGKKTANCVVFTNDPEAQEKALAAGAYRAGGESLVDEIVQGDIPVTSFQASVATTDIFAALSKKAARLLGPRKLMPNAKVGTLVDTPEELVEAVRTQVSGKELMYRTEKDGIVHVAVGKYSMGKDKILENIGEFLKELFNAKPESYGKGKQKVAAKKGQAVKKTQPQYVLRAHICSTQSKGFRIELRTIDPTSPFFMTDPALEATGGIAA